MKIKVRRSNHSFWSRMERLIRSRILGFPFVIVNALTKWEIYGKENFYSATMEAFKTGKGLITVSNHLCLFDDPLVIMALMRLYNFTVETKCWWSTACASNFNPRSRGLFPRFVRYFSDVSNMIFLSRARKRGDAPAEVLDDPVEYIASALDEESMALIMEIAKSHGKDINSWLRGFYTKGDDGFRGSMASLNQIGMIETIVRIAIGEWVHLFPEGGRSRNLSLKAPRHGAGKVIYHCPDAIVLPICFYGTQDILPVGCVFPRFFKHVVVEVGKPFTAETLIKQCPGPASVETFRKIAEFLMGKIADLRPSVLEKYLGREKALKILLEEAQIASALRQNGEEKKEKKIDIFVQPVFYEERNIISFDRMN